MQGRVAAVMGRPGVARAPGLGARADRVGVGGCGEGHFLSWELLLAQAQSSGYQDTVGAAWDVFIAPFDHQCVLPLVLEQVGDTVESTAHVLHQDLLTGRPGAVYPHQ